MTPGAAVCAYTRVPGQTAAHCRLAARLVIGDTGPSREAARVEVERRPAEKLFPRGFVVVAAGRQYRRRGSCQAPYKIRAPPVLVGRSDDAVAELALSVEVVKPEADVLPMLLVSATMDEVEVSMLLD